MRTGAHGDLTDRIAAVSRLAPGLWAGAGGKAMQFKSSIKSSTQLIKQKLVGHAAIVDSEQCGPVVVLAVKSPV